MDPLVRTAPERRGLFWRYSGTWRLRSLSVIQIGDSAFLVGKAADDVQDDQFDQECARLRQLTTHINPDAVFVPVNGRISFEAAPLHANPALPPSVRMQYDQIMVEQARRGGGRL